MCSKKLLFIFLILLSTAGPACGPSDSPSNTYDTTEAQEGKTVTAEILSKYSGNYFAPDYKLSLKMGPNGEFEMEVRFQVGREGGAIPYPTVCHYLISGTISKIYERTDRILKAATHTLIVNTTHYELIRDEKTEQLENCEQFISVENSKMPKQERHYVEFNSDSSFQLWDNGPGQKYIKNSA